MDLKCADEAVSAPTDAAVDEAELVHVSRLPDVAAVHDHWTAHRLLELAEIEAAELVPLREHRQRVRFARGAVSITGVDHAAVELVLGLGHCHRVIDLDMR